MSPVDPKITRYIEEANRMKEGEQRKAEREANKHKAKPHFPIDVESRRVYRALYPRKLTVAWTVALVAAIILYGITWLGELFPYDRPVAIAAIIGLFLWAIYRQLIMPSVWATLNRGWRSRLPFTLVGWNELLSDSRLLNHKYWRDLKITITPSTTSPDVESALDAALMLFGRKAFGTYYPSRSGAPSRLHWKSSAFYAEGSANNRVFGLLVELFTGPLARIAKMNDARMTVTIAPTKAFYFVKPDLTTSISFMP